MLTIAIASVIGLIFGILVYGRNRDEKFADIVGSIFVFAFIGGIICLSIPTEREKHVYARNELVSLKDNSSLSGNLFLGCGSIEGRMKYVFYVKTSEGIKLNQLDTYRATITYTKGIPYLVEYVNTDVSSKKSFRNYFGYTFNRYDYEFQVPEGSIANSYKLDAE